MRTFTRKKTVNRNPHALYIIDIAPLMHLFEAIPDCFEENNIKDPEQVNSCIDWVLMDVLSDVLASKTMRLSGHYRYDEGKVIKDCLLSEEIEAIYTFIEPRLRSFKTGRVAAMISGKSILVSKEIVE